MQISVLAFTHMRLSAAVAHLRIAKCDGDMVDVGGMGKSLWQRTATNEAQQGEEEECLEMKYY